MAAEAKFEKPSVSEEFEVSQIKQKIDQNYSYVQKSALETFLRHLSIKRKKKKDRIAALET
jgi:lipopolysaccharide export LptBFGC system permease protein LptF